MTTDAYLLAGLFVLAVLIFGLSLFLYVFQKWIENNSQQTEIDGAPPEQETTERQQLDRERPIIRHIATRLDAVADAIHTYRNQRNARDNAGDRNQKITIFVLFMSALFSFLAFLAAGGADLIFWQQTGEMREDKRAWLSPQAGGLIALSVGAPITAEIDYRNTGKEPAQHMTETLLPLIFSREDWTNSVAYKTITVVSGQCLTMSSAENGEVTYPNVLAHVVLTSHSGYGDLFGIAPRVMPNGATDGSEIIVLSGCFAYKTINREAHSSFCYYYQAGVTASINALGICTTGNYAD